jgi:NAD(P)H-nitrite reductase large subunit
MNPDDTVCFCFHVTCRKLRNFARQNKPKVASQMTECFGAGTGCGWCVPIIKKIWEQNGQPEGQSAPTTPEDYKKQREEYWLKKYGRPPKEGERGK